MATQTGIDVRPYSPLIGAEIAGLDLSHPLSDDVIKEVRATLNQYHVIFFRNQDLDPDSQTNFAAQFGTVTEGHPVIPHIKDHPNVLSIDGRGDRASWWHTDVTFLDTPPLGSILYMMECPKAGGDTMWASLQDAYDMLSCDVKEMCDKLIAVHHDPWFAAEVEERGGYQWDGEWRTKLSPALHPVVRTHPENGRKGLFVNGQFTRTILGMSDLESTAILAMLYHHCERPEVTCRFHWEPGSVAFWDNRATLHYALDDYGGELRKANRVTIRGEKTYGPAVKRPAEST